MFETFEHKADIGVRGKGPTLEKAFAECARAMFSVITDLETVEPKEEESFDLKADNREQLLVDFLNHLLYLEEVKESLYNRFDLYITEGGGEFVLKGKAFGEKAKKEKHTIKSGVKAASYHQLKVEESKGEFLAQCVVDV